MWKLNSNGTQFIPISKYIAYTDFEPLGLDYQTIFSPSAVARNLGLTFVPVFLEQL